jgi:triosephosphate isomerase
MSMQKPLLIGNWKLHHSRRTAEEFFMGLKNMPKELDLDLAVAPVAPMLDFVQGQIKGLPLSLAAQNVFYEEKGAFTGEWSASQLAELGVKYCIIGHSERRSFFHESDEDVFKKAQALLLASIFPVICIGESRQERDSGLTTTVLEKQLQALLSAKLSDSCEVIIAYEPLWAIGSGHTASPKEVEEIHTHIRLLLSKSWGKDRALKSRIIYGGSVKAENIREIVHSENVDGALVGGASLQCASFLSMVNEIIR